MLTISTCGLADSTSTRTSTVRNPILPSNNTSTKSPTPTVSSKSITSPLTPRRKGLKKREELVSNVVRIVSSPFPYMILLLVAAMVVMIFVDVMSISGLICVSAIIMVMALVLGNHWRGRPIWSSEASGSNQSSTSAGPAIANEDTHVPVPVHVHVPLTDEEKIDNMNEFFEELFKSLDYSLLFIFLGTFVVVANVESTGLPKKIWSGIVGEVPFKSLSSIIGISMFVLITSQLLGNVAVIQLAKPNVEVLGDGEKKLAWALLSFVATVGGNLTITGSAANIIVAEKCARIDPDSALDFFKHYKVCFWVTLASCFIGGAILMGLVSIDNALM